MLKNSFVYFWGDRNDKFDQKTTNESQSYEYWDSWIKRRHCVLFILETSNPLSASNIMLTCHSRVGLRLIIWQNDAFKICKIAIKQLQVYKISMKL